MTLSPFDLVTVGQVCTSWRKEVKRNVYWRNIYFNFDAFSSDNLNETNDLLYSITRVIRFAPVLKMFTGEWKLELPKSLHERQKLKLSIEQFRHALKISPVKILKMNFELFEIQNRTGLIGNDVWMIKFLKQKLPHAKQITIRKFYPWMFSLERIRLPQLESLRLIMPCNDCFARDDVDIHHFLENLEKNAPKLKLVEVDMAANDVCLDMLAEIFTINKWKHYHSNHDFLHYFYKGERPTSSRLEPWLPDELPLSCSHIQIIL